ncbi:MAG: hypothetical protein NVS3B10_22600 [Polyangiales bacterium]
MTRRVAAVAGAVSATVRIAMPTRRELIERVTSRVRARSGEDRLESSLSFLSALLVGITEVHAVPPAMLERVGEFLRVEPHELGDEPPPSNPRRNSSLRISSIPPPRPTRILLLGRGDPARMPMLHAVATARYSEIAEVRWASIAPVAVDARVLKVLRQAGYATAHLAPRTVSVDDMAWADLVVTATGTREEWERFIPRSIAHEHQPVPAPALPELAADADPLEALRQTLRHVERAIAAVRPARPSRFPPEVAPASLRAPPLPRITVPDDDES